MSNNTIDWMIESVMFVVCGAIAIYGAIVNGNAQRQ